MQMEDPTDMSAELACARAVLVMELEKYGFQYEAVKKAMEEGAPFQEPRVKGVIAALLAIERIQNSMLKKILVDAIPKERFCEVIIAMKAAAFEVITGESERKALLESWQEINVANA